MRPNHPINRISVYLNDEKAGLFLSNGCGYNFRQNLPLKSGPVRGSDGSSLPSEAAMKRSRQPKTTSPVDKVEQSAQAQGVETRAERLARIRREIEEGTYETPEKLDAAIERMLGILRD